jgi:hypothetical protein
MGSMSSHNHKNTDSFLYVYLIAFITFLYFYINFKNVANVDFSALYDVKTHRIWEVQLGRSVTTNNVWNTFIPFKSVPFGTIRQVWYHGILDSILDDSRRGRVSEYIPGSSNTYIPYWHADIFRSKMDTGKCDLPIELNFLNDIAINQPSSIMKVTALVYSHSRDSLMSSEFLENAIWLRGSVGDEIWKTFGSSYYAYP